MVTMSQFDPPVPGPTMHALSPAERLVVKVIRIWRLARAGHVGDCAWMAGMRRAGLPCCLDGCVDRLCHVIASGSRRPPEWQMPGDARIGRDEALLLRVLGLMQCHRQTQARRLLERHLWPAAAQRAQPLVHRLALGMSFAGLVIPATREYARDHAFRAASFAREPADLRQLH